MKASFIPNVDSSPIDQELLDEQGRLKLVSAAEIDGYPVDYVRHFCHRTGRYGLPTSELVEFLRTRIGSRRAIEIGAGNGDLGRLVGIPMTDSKMQSRPEIAFHYQMIGQPVIQYPDDVEELEALEAIDKHQPEVVIASWVTEWIDPDKPYTKKGSVFGVKEWLLLEKVKTYILIGNLDVHDDKQILKIPHECLEVPFLRGRSTSPEKDRIFIWNS